MRIGIITMHRVLNFGSVLQAYALQHIIQSMGHECEIIDYQFPRKTKERFSINKLKRNLLVFFRAILLGFPRQRTIKRFKTFQDRYLNLSEKAYDATEINLRPPVYDIYMTGSDQVWNPRHIGTDSNFLLSFAPSGKTKMSYAASFATSSIPVENEQIYCKYLPMYDSISVREPSGVKLVKALSGKDAYVCCDPVFLLDRHQWDDVSAASSINIQTKYILVYALYYMFDPYPELYNLINNVQRTLGYKVIYLNARKEDAFRPHSSILKSCGPADFIKLIKNAEVVITTSFHGTAFSLIYGKPLMAIVRKYDNSDNRISSLLHKLGADSLVFNYDGECVLTKSELYSLRVNQHNLDTYIKQSSDYLQNSISKYCNR